MTANAHLLPSSGHLALPDSGRWRTANLIYGCALLCFNSRMTDAFEGLQRAAIGSHCEITRHEHSWGFRFEGRCWIMVQCPWRIVSGGQIVFASEDDGHQFGLPAPVDGEAKARTIVGGFPLISLALDRTTADLTLSFDGGPRIDVFNNSMGYEGWQAGFSTEEGETGLVGGGGGGVDTFDRHSGS